MQIPVMVFFLVITLSACSVQPPKSLDEQLADSTHSKETTLRRACLIEADWSHSTHQPPATASTRQRYNYNYRQEPEIKDMRKFCWKMIRQEGTPEELNNECRIRVAKMRENPIAGYDAHADRIQHICNHMTGVMD